MTLDEALALDISKKSLRKLDTYLNHEQNTISYHKANAYKGLMLYKLGNLKEAFVCLLEALNKTCEPSIIITYCNPLIDIYLDLEDFSKAMKYIDLKSENLNPIELDKHTLDMIKYYVKRKDVINAKREIEVFLKDDISDKDKYFVYQILLNFAYEESKIDEFLKYYEPLLEFYKNSNDTINLSKIYLDKLYLYFNTNLIDSLISFIETTNIDFLDVKTKIIFHTYLIKAYIEQNNLRKASILDSNFEQEIFKNKDTYQDETKNYYLTTLSLYKALGNNYTINYIENILKDYSKEVVVNKEIKEKSRFKEFNQVVIENVIKETVEKDITDFKFKNSDKDTVLVSKEYHDLNDTINQIFNIDNTLQFREIFRQILMTFSKKHKFEEAYLYTGTHGFHYKNNKVYDKSKFDFDISRTINKRTIELAKEVVLHDLKATYYSVSILDGNDTPHKSCMSFPLFYQGKCVASLAYFFDEVEIDSYFEFFKLISSIISIYYISSIYLDNVKDSNETIKKLENDLDIGIKYIKDKEVLLNNKSVSLLDINCDMLDLDEYLNLIEKADQPIFLSAINKILFDGMSKYSFRYHLIDNKYIEDTFVKDEDNKIMSYMRDVTSESSLVDNLYKDISKSNLLDTLSYKNLNINFYNLIGESNRSLALIESNNYDTYYNLYGFEFAEGIIEGLSRTYNRLKKTYDYEVYYLDSDRFILLLNFNDQRRIKRVLEELIPKVKDEILKFNKRVNLDLHSGIYKFKKAEKNISLKDAINYAQEALIDSIKKDVSFMIYSQDLYEDSYYKEFLYEIDISEAIDKNKLSGNYLPVYDINNKNILGYSYKLSLDNVLIDEKTFKDVVKKRKLEYQIDKYLIEHVVSDLKTFYNKTGYYLNIFIPIYSQTLENENFIKHISNIFNFYKVNSNLLSFVINGEIKNDYNLNKLRGFINLGSDNLDNYFKFDLDTYYLNVDNIDIKYVYNLKKSIEKRLIVCNIKKLEDLNNIKDCCQYVTTSFNQRKMSINNLINEALGKE